MVSQTPTILSISKNNDNAQSIETQIAALQQEINLLYLVQQAKAYKMDKPGPYKGDKGTLQGFLTQNRAYFKYYRYQFNTYYNKIIFTGTRLKGNALIQFKPTLRDYLENIERNQDNNTKKIFRSFNYFKRAFKDAFRDLDEERSAKRKLIKLKQKGSASKYTVYFKQLTIYISWREDALISQFYKGLKEDVKNEISKMDQSDDFAKYVAIAVCIDNCLFKQRQEQQCKIPGN